MSTKSKFVALVLVVFVGAGILGGLGCDGQGNHAEVIVDTQDWAASWKVSVEPGGKDTDRQGALLGIGLGDHWTFSIQPGQLYKLTAQCEYYGGGSDSVSFSGDSSHRIKVTVQKIIGPAGACGTVTIALDQQE